MAQVIEDIMTKEIHSVGEHATLGQVARLMHDQQIGDVLVTDEHGKLRGIVTDRDIVVRAIADGKNVHATTVGQICTEQPTTLQADATVDEAVELMREKAIRRIPVVSDGVPIGIVSIGDVARQTEPGSTLASISASAPNN
jgi:CBS domain-containing protein